MRNYALTAEQGEDGESDFDSPIVPIGSTHLGELFEHAPNEGEPHSATECGSRGCYAAEKG